MGPADPGGDVGRSGGPATPIDEGGVRGNGSNSSGIWKLSSPTSFSGANVANVCRTIGSVVGTGGGRVDCGSSTGDDAVGSGLSSAAGEDGSGLSTGDAGVGLERWGGRLVLGRDAKVGLGRCGCESVMVFPGRITVNLES